ncbi:MAG: uracil-xanthine permease [Clostridia bacterium]|nr:uracil-xanthine permease [Clostridia bacterium]
MKLTYNVKDKPKAGQVIVFALQQLLAIMAATIAVPSIVQNGMSQTAALFGAGVGTLVYLLFTKFKSPVFLGSSFAFLPSMFAAFAGGVSMSLGYVGLIIGAVFAGLVYVIIALVVKFAGTKWIDKIMPAVVIGPTVAIIGLGLAGNAVGDLQTSGTAYKVAQDIVENGAVVGNQLVTKQDTSVYVCIICGLVTLCVTMLCSVFGKKMMKMIPFIIGILSGYAVAAIFTVIGITTGNDALKVINFGLFSDIKWLPDFTFIKAFEGIKELNGGYIATIAVAYIPVAFVVFAEHIADHKNLSSIIESDLTKDPGLHRTLLGDGVGSMAGAFFGGCPNTTYGESIGCVAISGNASVITVLVTAFLAIGVSFIGPFATFLATIPACVMGGVCISLYGFIAVSGLKMIQKSDLGDNRNLFVVSIVLISGIGGLSLTFGKITITNVACAVILGILTNLMLNGKKKAAETTETTETAETVEVTEENK